MGTTTKIMLALVIVSGLTAIGLGIFYVPGKIQTKIDVASKEAGEKIGKANIDLATVKSKFEKSESELTTAKSELVTANTEKAKFKSDSDSSNIALLEETKQSLANKQLANDAMKQRDDAQKQLAVYQGYKKIAEEFQALGIPLDDIKKQLDELKTYKSVATPSQGGKVATGITGVIKSVDYRLGFVIIDIGTSKGFKVAELMTVSRKGKYVGQIKVRSVQSSLAIADVVKGMSKEELREGDVVAVTNF